MLSEYWSALRTRTGPRSSWSASRGAQSWRRSNSVVMSSSRLPGVSALGVERRRVQDRLERRAGLPRAVAGRVVLGLELAAGQVVAGVAGAADVGQHVAGPVVERDERAVVEVLAAQRADPARSRPAILSSSSSRLACARA